jgi:hypothetical protein
VSVAVAQEKVSNRRLRKELERREQLGWVTKEIVAARLGWTHTHSGRPDTSLLSRQLGLSITHRKHNGAPCYRRKIGRELAAEIAEAIGVDPFEVGL